ncbi:hypothetical protein R69746_06174 [Paraburkholderia aspalathi]|uniref:helix-turn-helix domain-containing protein n=1 Tax=Paraburkholderia aspalathi TaxID=1324617 RepID=UPI00190AA729|nr:LysR family transcriptional regulator [Paraburkholderia aspalathi]MBK3844347.1 LysR family transcriptional regulator [Paraburkholderia aspalathi]CAE6823710.1 hypothetical protein R69746_06174 [Paraburkholderia aspalathi]
MNTPNAKARLNWNLLRDFLIIVRYDTFADAARATGITRPAISRKISELERLLGCAIAHRQRGRSDLTLTAQGQHLHKIVVAFATQLASLDYGSGAPQESLSTLREAEAVLEAAQRLVKTLHAECAARGDTG